MKIAFAFFAVRLAVATPGRTETTLVFSTSAEGFTDSLAAGGALTRVSDIGGGGSLRLDHPAAWTWRASAEFHKSNSGRVSQVEWHLVSGGVLPMELPAAGNATFYRVHSAAS